MLVHVIWKAMLLITAAEHMGDPHLWMFEVPYWFFVADPNIFILFSRWCPCTSPQLSQELVRFLWCQAMFPIFDRSFPCLFTMEVTEVNDTKNSGSSYLVVLCLASIREMVFPYFKRSICHFCWWIQIRVFPYFKRMSICHFCWWIQIRVFLWLFTCRRIFTFFTFSSSAVAVTVSAAWTEEVCIKVSFLPVLDLYSEVFLVIFRML